MEKQLVQFNIPGMTAQQYDKCWDELRKAGHENPNGLIHHVGAQHGDNWIVVDVWESMEHFHDFGEILMPILQKIGAPDVQPTISSVHYELFGAVTA